MLLGIHLGVKYLGGLSLRIWIMGSCQNLQLLHYGWLLEFDQQWFLRDGVSILTPFCLLVRDEQLTCHTHIFTIPFYFTSIQRWNCIFLIIMLMSILINNNQWMKVRSLQSSLVLTAVKLYHTFFRKSEWE